MQPAQPADDIAPLGDSVNAPCSKAIGGSVVVRLVLAALITGLGVQYSFHHGRLIHRPMADDASYFVDGLQRLNALYAGGVWRLLRDLANDPPHAPFSSLLAMVSFAVFGRHDWAPYAGNGVIIFALLTAVDWVLPNLKSWQRGLMYAMVLSTHWPWTAVTEFRPDLATGLATAVAIIYCLRESLIDSSVGHRFRVGAWFGLAILLKPTLSPVTAFLFAGCLCTGVVIDILMRSERPGLKKIVAAIVQTAVGAIVVALPFYAVGWKTTWDYIASNVFGDRKTIWQYNQGSALDRLRYYLDHNQTGGSFVLGVGHLYLLAALVAVGVVIILAGKSRARKLRMMGMILIGLVAWAIPTLSKTKNLFFGAAFQTLLLLGAVMVLGLLLKCSRRCGCIIFVTACLVSVGMMKPPFDRGNPWDYQVASSNRLLDQVYSAVEQGQMGDRIFVPASGVSVSWNTMNYLSLCDDSRRRFFNLDYGQWDDRAEIEAELDQADWVVAGEAGNDEARLDLPNGREGLGMYLEAVRQRTDFAQVAQFPAWKDHAYYVFKRTTPAFWGFDEASARGLGAPDGPHPEWKLPIVRAAGGEPTVLEIPDGAEKRTLVMSFSCGSSDQTIQVDLDGNEIASGRYLAAGDFVDMRVPLQMGAGRHRLKIEVSPHNVLFKKIQVIQ